jgi:hypothetical protein
MRSNYATLLLGFAAWFAPGAKMRAADTSTVAYRQISYSPCFDLRGTSPLCAVQIP